MKNKEKNLLVGYINPFLLKSIYQIESFQDGDTIDSFSAWIELIANSIHFHMICLLSFVLMLLSLLVARI